ncbi:DNA repair exonuclease [Halosimplex pelagicum]|uniref:DNA repair exonuclease n=1 Tax=Halosimplex pelagicum TaxID=869886 RepID=A0A7D5T610_9EURY|nr:DNA repair exonuclease [Halosimplex pelagicum]QLH83811.1 DNA repair exonuclease [Halosimplex pelagicum]
MSRTRLLHISDSHLGKRQYGSDIRREDFANAFEQAIDIAIERGVDAVIHTGDLFDDPVPSLPTVMRAADALKPLEEREIPFYGIVGNHERKNDEQWLDLLRRTSAAARLSKEPTMVGDVALYGIDAVRPSVWDSAEFELEEPPEEASWTILSMHELLSPLATGMGRVYPASEVLDRVGIELDGLALGDLHQPESSVVNGTDVWYASATERGGKDQEETGVVQLIDVDDDGIHRRQIELETRPFSVFEIPFGEDDGISHVRAVLERHDLDGAVAKIELSGERGAVTANEVTQIARDAGAAVVSVDDNRGRVDLDVESIEAMSLQGLDGAIEDQLKDEDLSGVALDIDARVREDGELDTNVNRVADDFEEPIREAQDAAFDDIEAAEPPEEAEAMEVDE